MNGKKNRFQTNAYLNENGIFPHNFNWSDVQSNTKFNKTTYYQKQPECPRDNTLARLSGLP